MRSYEAIYILRPNAETEVKAEVLERAKNIISENGEVESVEEWGNKRLAYEIKNFTEGYYVVINYTGDHAANQKLEKHFRVTDDIIRSMIVKLED
jgi:small subunit ribosomal protein S6